MADYATFRAPNGGDASLAIRHELHVLMTPTVGDLLYVGQVFRSQIRTRTFAGIDVNGAPFTPYSTKGPYYFYPNREVGKVRGGSAAVQKARSKAAAGRFKKTGREGKRTPFGIRYASYAAAKAAHGVLQPNLYGLEQHTHMLDTMMVRCNGQEVPIDLDASTLAADATAMENTVPATELTLGFYGPEADRAKGNNEGTRTVPRREFFALNATDLGIGEQAIAERLQIRARVA